LVNTTIREHSSLSCSLPSWSHLVTCALSLFFFFNAPAPTEIYTLSLHDALPISVDRRFRQAGYNGHPRFGVGRRTGDSDGRALRSEEHTSELQSPCNLVCRLLLEKKKKKTISTTTHTYADVVTLSLLTCTCMH